jgi:hypothetical protein
MHHTFSLIRISFGFVGNMIGGNKMVFRDDLETAVRNMVAYDILSKPLSSLGQKAGRREKKLAVEAAGLLENTGPTERIVAYTEVRNEERARTVRDGINAFKEAHPRYGAKLEGMIQQKRFEKNNYIVFGVAEGFRLGASDYRSVMKDLGMTTIEADTMYGHILNISERLGKAGESETRSILLP